MKPSKNTKPRQSSRTFPRRLSLPPLSDGDYDRLSLSVSIPLDECPTCRAKKIEVAPHIYGWENGTYTLDGIEYDCDCDTQILLRKHYLKANIGDQYQRLNWDDYDGDDNLKKNVALYLDKWEGMRMLGMGLTLKGPLGSGKTFAATHVGKELVKRGIDVYFISFDDVISAYQKSNAEEIDRKLRQTGFLILDELIPHTSGAQSSYFQREFESVIRHRTNFNLPTIITTNMSEDDLLEKYPRSYSLLAAKQLPIDVAQITDARREKIGQRNLRLVTTDEMAPIT